MKKKPLTEINIGLAVRQKLNEYGVKISWLAQEVNIDRGNLSRHLKKEHIDLKLLLNICIALKTDFFSYYTCFVIKKIKNELKNK